MFEKLLSSKRKEHKTYKKLFETMERKSNKTWYLKKCSKL